MNRVFRIEGGPLAQAIKEVTAERERIGRQYSIFGSTVDCEQVHTWPWTGRFAGCSFAKGNEPKLADWRLSHRMWVPRKKTVRGAAIWASVQKLEPLPATQTVLEQYGLTVHKPQLDVLGAGPSYVEGFGHVGVYYVHVPWFEPLVEHLELLQAMGETNKDIDFVTTWKAPNSWVEISEFQKLNEWMELDRK